MNITLDDYLELNSKGNVSRALWFKYITNIKNIDIMCTNLQFPIEYDIIANYYTQEPSKMTNILGKSIQKNEVYSNHLTIYIYDISNKTVLAVACCSINISQKMLHLHSLASISSGYKCDYYRMKNIEKYNGKAFELFGSLLLTSISYICLCHKYYFQLIDNSHRYRNKQTERKTFYTQFFEYGLCNKANNEKSLLLESYPIMKESQIIPPKQYYIKYFSELSGEYYESKNNFPSAINNIKTANFITEQRYNFIKDTTLAYSKDQQRLHKELGIEYKEEANYINFLNGKNNNTTQIIKTSNTYHLMSKTFYSFKKEYKEQTDHTRLQLKEFLNRIFIEKLCSDKEAEKAIFFLYYYCKKIIYTNTRTNTIVLVLAIVLSSIEGKKTEYSDYKLNIQSRLIDLMNKFSKLKELVEETTKQPIINEKIEPFYNFISKIYDTPPTYKKYWYEEAKKFTVN